MRTNEHFREIFRNVPDVYNRRKFYYKAFRYMEKYKKDELKDIDIFLWNLQEFDDDAFQLKSLFLEIQLMIQENTAYSWLPSMFIQSVLYDMRSLPNNPLKAIHFKICTNIANSRYDIPSFYPAIFKPGFC